MDFSVVRLQSAKECILNLEEKGKDPDFTGER